MSETSRSRNALLRGALAGITHDHTQPDKTQRASQGSGMLPIDASAHLPQLGLAKCRIRRRSHPQGCASTVYSQPRYLYGGELPDLRISGTLRFVDANA